MVSLHKRDRKIHRIKIRFGIDRHLVKEFRDRFPEEGVKTLQQSFNDVIHTFIFTQ